MCQTETKTTAIRNKKIQRISTKTKMRYKTQAKMQQKQNCHTITQRDLKLSRGKNMQSDTKSGKISAGYRVRDTKQTEIMYL